MGTETESEPGSEFWLCLPSCGHCSRNPKCFYLSNRIQRSGLSAVIYVKSSTQYLCYRCVSNYYNRLAVILAGRVRTCHVRAPCQAEQGLPRTRRGPPRAGVQVAGDPVGARGDTCKLHYRFCQEDFLTELWFLWVLR